MAVYQPNFASRNQQTQEKKESGRRSDTWSRHHVVQGRNTCVCVRICLCVCWWSEQRQAFLVNTDVCVISAIFVSLIWLLCAMCIFCVCVCIWVCVFLSTPMHAPYEHAERKEVDRHVSMNKEIALKLENSLINQDLFWMLMWLSGRCRVCLLADAGVQTTCTSVWYCSVILQASR